MKNLEEMRKRMGEIAAKLKEFQALDGFTDDQLNEINALHGEYEGLVKNIEAAEKLNAISEGVNSSAGRQTKPDGVKPSYGSSASVTHSRQVEDNFGFESSGHYFKAIKDFAMGKVDTRLTKILDASQSEGVGADGGFLVPTDMRQEIQKKIMGDASLLPLTRQFKTSSNKLELPVNEVAPWDGTGIVAYWGQEEQVHTASRTKFDLAEWKLNKLTAYVTVTDELMEDAPAIESYIRQEAPEALIHKINSAIIAGDGVGKPLGFLNSAFTYSVAAEGGQAADTVRFENVNKMFGRLLPQSVGKAFWLVHPEVLPQLRLMKFDNAAASPVPVYLPGNSVAGAPYGTLMGLPIKVCMGGVKALGDVGDISLIDLSYYYTVMKTNGFKSEINPYILWDRDAKAIKFQIRLGGHCPYKAPVTTENGSFSMSSFVTLAAR